MSLSLLIRTLRASFIPHLTYATEYLSTILDYNIVDGMYMYIVSTIYTHSNRHNSMSTISNDYICVVQPYKYPCIFS